VITSLLDYDVRLPHANSAVEKRAQEIEAYILAQLRVSGINPADVVLVVERTAFGPERYWLEIRK
jgi:hypothetical protein